MKAARERKPLKRPRRPRAATPSPSPARRGKLAGKTDGHHGEAMMQRLTTATLLLLAALTGAQTQVQAQDYPAKTVTVIVPFAAGGPADVTGRIVADIFTRHLGQTF